MYHQPCLLQLAQAGHLRFEDSNGVPTDLVPSINDFRVIEAGVEILEKCKVTTKIFEQEKIPTIPLVTERLYTVDQELKEFMQNDNNKRNKRKAVVFARILREKLNSRFPKFGTDRSLNYMGNLINPSLKGVHLKLVDKFEQTKKLMVEKLEEWMGVEMEKPIEEEEQDDGRSPPAKLSVTEMLKRRMRQEEEKRDGLAGVTFSRRASLRGNVAATSSCLMLTAASTSCFGGRTTSSSSHCSPTWPGLFLLSLLQAQRVRGCSVWPATL